MPIVATHRARPRASPRSNRVHRRRAPSRQRRMRRARRATPSTGARRRARRQARQQNVRSRAIEVGGGDIGDRARRSPLPSPRQPQRPGSRGAGPATPLSEPPSGRWSNSYGAFRASRASLAHVSTVRRSWDVVSNERRDRHRRPSHHRGRGCRDGCLTPLSHSGHPSWGRERAHVASRDRASKRSGRRRSPRPWSLPKSWVGPAATSAPARGGAAGRRVRHPAARPSTTSSRRCGPGASRSSKTTSSIPGPATRHEPGDQRIRSLRTGDGPPRADGRMRSRNSPAASRRAPVRPPRSNVARCREDARPRLDVLVRRGRRAEEEFLRHNLRLVLNIAKNYQRSRPRPRRRLPGGRVRAAPGRAEVRPHEGLQVLDVRDVVGAPVDHACDREPGSHHSDPRPHGRRT